MKFIAQSFIAALSLVAASGAFATVCAPASTPNNCAPPTGAIFDLNGTPIPHSYTLYSTSFVASQAVTNLSFALRDDPAFLHLDDVVLTTGAGTNLLTNGGFELGPLGANAPTGWTYLNQFGAAANGVVSTSGPHTGSYDYFDGAIQAYDGITQSVATIIGQTYNLSFYLYEDGQLNTFSRLSTNGNTTSSGGNGIDLLVYAGAVPRLAVPEPESIALLGIGAAGLALAAKRRRR